MNKVCSCFFSFRGRRLLRRRRIRPRLLRGRLVASVAAEGDKREKGGFDGQMARIKKNIFFLCVSVWEVSVRTVRDGINCFSERKCSGTYNTFRQQLARRLLYAGEVLAIATFGRKTKMAGASFAQLHSTGAPGQMLWNESLN